MSTKALFCFFLKANERNSHCMKKNLPGALGRLNIGQKHCDAAFIGTHVREDTFILM